MNIIKGLEYERFVKHFIINKLNKPTYLWNECPEEILIENNLVSSHNHLRIIRKDIKEGHLHFHKDIGIDLIQIDDNDISLIQAKNGYSSGIRVEDIAGIMMRTSFSRKNTFIYYTNSISKNILYTGNLSPYVRFIENLDDLIENSYASINFIHLSINNPPEIKTKSTIIPYDYQLEAINKFKNHYENYNRGILSLPCGCGKTFISFNIAINYDKIIIISPLREFAFQNLNRFIEYGYNEKSLLVDSDGTRDFEEIQNFIAKNQKFLISTTYKSLDIISNLLNSFENSLFIIDEFHNISKANLLNENDNMFKLLNSNHNILFMSATPRIYDIEEDDYVKEDFENLLGTIVYSMNFNEAISNNYICDYKVWIPSIHENNEKLDEELSIFDIDDEIKNKCKFLYSCLLNNGSRKTIIYTKDKCDMIKMMNGMKSLNEFFMIDFDMYSLNSNNTDKERKEIIKRFSKNNDKIQLLFNIRILNECIDIPSCDSIYISSPPNNKITTIQRVNRATRKNKDNPYKIANIFIWCDKYNDLLNCLSTFKEYDNLFKDKIKINQINYYNSKTDKDIELIEKDKRIFSNVIINVKEFIQLSFEERLKIIIDYIENNGKIPSRSDINNEVKTLANWINGQKQNYKDNKLNNNSKKLWEDFIEKYQHLFRDNIKDWKANLKLLEEFIIKEKRLPKDKEFRWLSHQKENYKNKLMLNDDILKLWEDFTKKYEELFVDFEEIWFKNLKSLEDYVKIHNKFPNCRDINNEIKSLATWKSVQIQNYKNNNHCMKNENIKTKWEEFVNKYDYLFKDIVRIWNNKFKLLEEYVIKNGKLPNEKMKNKTDANLGQWTSNQKKNYKNKEDSMRNESIRKKWEDFMERYPELFMNYEQKWNYTLELLKKFIKDNERMPRMRDTIPLGKTLYRWYLSNRKKGKLDSINLLLDT